MLRIWQVLGIQRNQRSLLLPMWLSGLDFTASHTFEGQYQDRGSAALAAIGGNPSRCFSSSHSCHC